MYDQDRQYIETFVSDVYSWLAALYLRDKSRIKEGTWPFLIDTANNAAVDLRAEAWSEFEVAVPLDDLLSRVRSLEDDEIRLHGLFGAQLQLKISEIRDQLQRVIASIKKGRVRGFGKLVEVIDILLESIAGAAGLPGALIEIKDLLKVWREVRAG